VQRARISTPTHDGLPDWWEIIKGLNRIHRRKIFPTATRSDGDEYTNLEDYLNWLAALHFDCTNARRST